MRERVNTMHGPIQSRETVHLNICENVSTFLDLRRPEEIERDLKQEVKIQK